MAFQEVVDRFRQARPVQHRGDRIGDPMVLTPVVAPTPDGQTGQPEQRLAGFDLTSVAGVATRFFAWAVAIVMGGVLVLWVLGSLLGVVSAFEEFMRGIGFTGFRLLSFELLAGLALIAGAIGAGMIAMTIVAAGLYNAIAKRHGGVRVFLSTAPVAGNVTTNGSGTRANGNGTGSRAKPPRVRRSGLAKPSAASR